MADGLGLEIVLGVEDVKEGEVMPPAPPPAGVQTLRRSHQMAAQMLAQGSTVQATAATVGMHPGRLYTMLANDPSFKELVAAYSAGMDADALDLMRQSAMVAADLTQDFHQRWTDGEIELSPTEQLDAIKMFMDRGGNAPIGRSVGKNLNVHVGIAEAMDRMKRLREDAA